MSVDPRMSRRIHEVKCILEGLVQEHLELEEELLCPQNNYDLGKI